MLFEKADNHCHFGGSITPEIIWQIMEFKNIKTTRTIHQLRKEMIISPQEIGLGFQRFLKKFNVLNQIQWDKDSIRFCTKKVCENYIKNDIKYINVSLSLNKYCNGMTPNEAAEVILDVFESNSNVIMINPLLAIPYNSDKDFQIFIMKSIMEDKNLFERFKGIDLVGDESYFDCELYKNNLKKWRNKCIRAHVGEIKGTSKNVYEAIEILGVDRIAHGIFADDESIIKASEKGIWFDLAINSNMYIGSVKDITKHPIKNILNKGCRVTLSTDDPIQFSCDVEDEYKLAINKDLISEADSLLLSNIAIESVKRINLL